MIETPLGEARFIYFDGNDRRVLCQCANGMYAWFGADECYAAEARKWT